MCVCVLLLLKEILSIINIVVHLISLIFILCLLENVQLVKDCMITKERSHFHKLARFVVTTSLSRLSMQVFMSLPRHFKVF